MKRLIVGNKPAVEAKPAKVQSMTGFGLIASIPMIANQYQEPAFASASRTTTSDTDARRRNFPASIRAAI